jgi:hypothetical protein
VLELADVLANRRSSDAGVARDVHVVCARHESACGGTLRAGKLTAEGEDDALNLRRQLARGRENEGLGIADGRVDGLEHGDREGGGFTGSRLGLSRAAVSGSSNIISESHSPGQ